MPTIPTPHDWWKSAVVYQVYPRSFADSNGDGIGDVRGIIEPLDHLVALGVDALWISPWYPSPLADGGYDVSDYCAINPDFGTLGDADALVARAHELGLRVIIDLVPNHSSEEHPWFKDALAAAPVRLSATATSSEMAAEKTANSLRTTGHRCSEVVHGNASLSPTAPLGSGTCTSSTSHSPTGPGKAPKSSRRLTAF